ncbi:Glycosyl transferase, group 1 [Arcticibacter svalbardensis MN12-7]|uniref:Glycosyl transferase, group 1 n=1 Tax=Arcticibacter svalbardensis MN12-7 TaxID=1150600 RepID=R9GMJ6_9SPHI|nr:glycosyltransferase family 1 protein [Arcticibacter svalbardensis]EOR92953.1 Glycosyl transferase, group 1 [Arcticibacter svalbardensis MN12-7]
MKTRIAFISEHASPLATLGGVDSGGQNVYVAELSKHLVELGYEIDIFTRCDQENLPHVVYWEKSLRVVHVQAGPAVSLPKEELWQYMPQFTDSIISFIQQENLTYEIIHANFWMSGWVASELKETLGIPFIITFHALGYIRRLYHQEEDKFPAIRIEIEKGIVQTADKIIAECPQDKDDLMNFYQASPDKITIIPCGFSKKEFYPVSKKYARKKLHLDNSEKIVLQLGRMVPRKGIDNVIRAVVQLKQTGYDVRLIIVGGDTDTPDPALSPELSRLMNIVKLENINDSVDFVGRKDRQVLKYYYSAADVFVTTPWYEPFGITPLEAMACGTPVIGSNVGGIKYSVEDGKTGFLVPPDKPEELAIKIKWLLSDRDLMRTMKLNSIHRVNAMFTWKNVSDLVAEQYHLLPKPLKIPVIINTEIKAA